MKPLKIDRISESVIGIKWDNGDQTICFAKTLRQHCPCAVCQDERKNRDPLKVLKSDQKQIELVRWEPVGNYAVRLDWSDGHNTGIYTYEYLRQLSEDA